jgi:hypothetical protein
MKLSTGKTNMRDINDLPQCNMAHNCHYVKSTAENRALAQQDGARPPTEKATFPSPRLCVYEGGHRSKFFRKQPEELR